MDNNTANLLTAYNLASHNLTLSLSKIALFLHRDMEPDITYYENSIRHVQDLQMILFVLEDWLYKQKESE